METIENAAPPTSVRTAAATAQRMRNREEAAADLLVSRGWEVNTPEGEDWGEIRLRERRSTAS